MGKRFYKIAGGLIRTFSRPMTTEWEEPFEDGPCVFVVNHVGAIGPVDMCVKFPLRDRCHPWINDGVLDAKKVPAYVRQDYWWKPGSFFAPLWNVTIPYLAALVLPPILRSVQYVPVYHDQRIMLTLRQSVRVLQQDEALIVFPEQPSGWLSHQEWINTGWLRLGELWYRSSGRALKMYPVHIDRKGRRFVISKPVWYDPARRFAEQEKELADALAKGLKGK